MHFKRLELIGFKSFADKTLVQFEPGVTAIVGPNGCGKSNIADAIRWVLGEQSAKSLRGASMEDVIFNGSAIKEPLNLAEVSLTLSNETRVLPIDYDEVTITRRLFRSGESEYLINKNIVRLKDIHEMLMGTGLGTDSYSIIEQGKMDLILNSKPEDRRSIFEEAAGITKFKAKKKEALRKLEQTDANLLRVNDIIQEVKRQIGSIERQAKKAEIYKVEFEKLKTLELAVAGHEFLLFAQDRRGKEEELARLKAEETSCHEAASTIGGRCQEKRAQLDAAEKSVNETSAKELMAQAEMRRLQDRILLNRERVGELAERSGSIAREMGEIEKRVQGLHAQLEGLDAQASEALEEEKKGQSVLDAAEQVCRAAEHALAEALSQQEAVNRRITEAHTRSLRAQAEGAKVRAEIAAVGSRIRRARHDEGVLLAEIRQIDESLSLPLFEGAQTSQLETKIREWKDKLLTVVRGWLSRDTRSLSGEDEASWEREVRRFADEIGRLQPTADHREIELRHQRENRSRLEERLAKLADEIREWETEEASLRDKEKQAEAGAALSAEEDLAMNASSAETDKLLDQRRSEREKHLVGLAETRSRQATLSDRRAQAEKDRGWIVETERGQKALAESLTREAEESVARRAAIESESAGLAADAERLSAERDGFVRALEGLRREREQLLTDLDVLERERQEKQRFLDEARDRVHGFEMQSAEIRFEMDRLKERIFNAYNVDLALGDEQGNTERQAQDAFGAAKVFDLETAKTQVAALKEKIGKMGPVNLVAIQEYDEMRERYDFLSQQQADLVAAKDDLHKAILKMNRQTREMFTETFEKIRKNFTEYFKLLFGGGSAELLLLDEEDVLESGIEIVTRPPGKKLQNITLLSGGEKALTAVALLFSIFKVRPSPFCILDEIDAPLDESNVDRFCNVLKEFITGSQFILVTHNKRTMNLADVLYGITMVETGVSRIVSVKFSERSATKPKDKEEVLV